jgi:AraC family transcriptional regulator
MKPQTRIQYAQRLAPVLRWLASHPDADPDLHLLADLACLSPYHFHRIYRAMAGETVNATVQRVRMHRAAIALADTRDSLQVVASRAGYASDAAFTRAFGARFGIPPGQYRSARSRPFDLQEPGMYPITFTTFPGMTLAALPHRGSYQDIGTTFMHLFTLAGSSGLAQPEVPGIGVYFDDPEQVPIQQLRALAGVPVDPQAAFGGAFERFDIPAGRCAVLTYTGPYNEMAAAYQWMFSQWLPTSGLEPVDFPVFEQYLNDPRTTPPAQLQTQICLLVREG